MKISKLQIDQFRHLENLDFDFTYQSGERKGQPLDKICFIGQSATGKTSLLELICEQFSFVNNLFVNENSFNNSPRNIKSIDGYIKFVWNNNTVELNKNELKYNDRIYLDKKEAELTFYGELFKNPDEKKRLLYFKANIISEQNLDFFSNNPLDLIEKHNKDIEDTIRYFKYEHNGEYVFNEKINESIWLSILKEILLYRKNHYQKMSELINIGLLGNPSKLTSEFTTWQKENPNLLEFFAKEFNPILDKLNLEVDLVDTQFSIPIKNKKKDEIIPIQNTSTGTKGLLLSFLPLFKLDTKDSIILVDEPERSLYPDMQMDLMTHYQRLAPDAQFIVATHSPFIAASFEADERFILYFDEEGKVAVRRGSSPIGDDPNDILYKDFNIDYINKEGKEAHKEYLELKQKIYFEQDLVEKQKLIKKSEKLGDSYNF